MSFLSLVALPLSPWAPGELVCCARLPAWTYPRERLRIKARRPQGRTAFSDGLGALDNPNVNLNQ
jgi:hypothetical protein